MQINQQKLLPHTLTMTATPIPRTMHLAFLNWLDISSLDHIPQNKRKTKSRLVPEKKRVAFYHWLEKNILEKNQQLLVICPLIDQQTKVQEKTQDKTKTSQIKSPKTNFKNRKRHIQKDKKIITILTNKNLYKTHAPLNNIIKRGK